jgi:hypothetical protein
MFLKKREFHLATPAFRQPSKWLWSFVLGILVLSFTVSEDAEARRRRKSRSGANCLNRSCTVFINDPLQNALNSLLGGVSLGRGFSGRHSFYGRRNRNRFLDAYINNLIFQSLLGNGRFISANPYPNLGLNSLLLSGEIGFLDPLPLVSPNYPYTPKTFEPFQTGGDRALGPNDPVPTPPSPQPPTGPEAIQPREAPEELPPPVPSHSSDGGSNSFGGRPTAPIDNNATVVQPISSQARQGSETFPESGLDWQFTLLEEAVRRKGGKSAFGTRRLNSALCNRAKNHSRTLATESSRRGALSAHHNGFSAGIGVAEIVAGATARSAAEAAASCVDSWIKSPGHARHLFAAYSEYCYAIVPVGNFYSCTGVFR